MIQKAEFEKGTYIQRGTYFLINTNVAKTKLRREI